MIEHVGVIFNLLHVKFVLCFIFIHVVMKLFPMSSNIYWYELPPMCSEIKNRIYITWVPVLFTHCIEYLNLSQRMTSTQKHMYTSSKQLSTYKANPRQFKSLPWFTEEFKIWLNIYLQFTPFALGEITQVDEIRPQNKDQHIKYCCRAISGHGLSEINTSHFDM